MTGLFAKVPHPNSLCDSVRKGRIAMAVRRRRRSSLRFVDRAFRDTGCRVVSRWVSSGNSRRKRGLFGVGIRPVPQRRHTRQSCDFGFGRDCSIVRGIASKGATNVAMRPKANCNARVLECRKTGGSSSQARSIAEIDGRPSAVHLDPRKRRPTVAVSEFALLDRCAVFPGGRLTTPVSAAW